MMMMMLLFNANTTTLMDTTTIPHASTLKDATAVVRVVVQQVLS
jgi:hypothetical protein